MLRQQESSRLLSRAGRHPDSYLTETASNSQNTYIDSPSAVISRVCVLMERCAI